MSTYYQSPDKTEILRDYCPKGWNKISQKAGKQHFKDSAVSYLKTLCDGRVFYTVLRSVSASGMSRTMSIFVAGNEGEILDITWYVANVLDYKMTDKKGYRSIIVGGCGMDMGFHVIYSLSRVLFADAHDMKDAGYTLKQQWL